MATKQSQIVVCTYRVKPGNDAAFIKLLRRHWPTLDRLGLVEPQPRLALRGLAAQSRNDFREVFAWKPGALDIARKAPEVLAIWEPMEGLCEPRDGQPAMEFPHYETVEG